MDKINSRLFIGSVDDLKEWESLDGIDFHLNLSSWTDSQLAHEKSYTHISIEDGAAEYWDFKQAVDVLVDRLENTEDTILVNCAAGISRSVSVLATSLAVTQGLSMVEAKNQVQEKRGVHQNPHPSLISRGEKYLRQRRDN